MQINDGNLVSYSKTTYIAFCVFNLYFFSCIWRLSCTLWSSGLSARRDRKWSKNSDDCITIEHGSDLTSKTLLLWNTLAEIYKDTKTLYQGKGSRCFVSTALRLLGFTFPSLQDPKILRHVWIKYISLKCLPLCKYYNLYFWRWKCPRFGCRRNKRKEGWIEPLLPHINTHPAPNWADGN